MRRDIDPIKIIKILPLSGRSGRNPEDPNPWSEFFKKAWQASKEAARRMSAGFHSATTRVRGASRSLFEAFVTRLNGRDKTEPRIPGVLPPPSSPHDAPISAPPPPAQRSDTESPPAPHPAVVWLLSVRNTVGTRWPAQRARLEVMKKNAVAHAGQWGQRIRHAWGTQESWRRKTEQVVRPLMSSVRSLRRRHQTLLDELRFTQSLVRKQQEELTELSSHVVHLKTEVGAHKQRLEEATSQLNSLQSKVAQALPTTQGTTGQSGPLPHPRRGAPNKRTGQSEPEHQSRAEH